MEKIPALFKPTENKKSLIKMSRERSSFTKVLLFLDSSSSSEKNSREIMWLPHHSLLMLILIGVKFENKKKMRHREGAADGSSSHLHLTFF